MTMRCRLDQQRRWSGNWSWNLRRGRFFGCFRGGRWPQISLFMFNKGPMGVLVGALFDISPLHGYLQLRPLIIQGFFHVELFINSLFGWGAWKERRINVAANSLLKSAFTLTGVLSFVESAFSYIHPRTQRHVFMRFYVKFSFCLSHKYWSASFLWTWRIFPGWKPLFDFIVINQILQSLQFSLSNGMHSDLKIQCSVFFKNLVIVSGELLDINILKLRKTLRWK
jgi:hypothetical protein